jgi:hypothetical protein
MEEWYGGYKMTENIGNLPAHVRVIANQVDTVTVMAAADAIVTLHGTAALEAAAAGVPVIAADRSYYSDWGFVHAASDTSHYRELLERVGRLPRPDAAQRDLAHACFALAYSGPDPQLGLLRVPCDSLGAELYDQVRAMVTENRNALGQEVDRLAEFLAQGRIDSYATHAVVKWASRSNTAAARAHAVEGISR